VEELVGGSPSAPAAGASAPPPTVTTPPGAHEQLDSALWVQTSGEYYAIARQTFAAAAEKLDLALRDSTWTASTEQFSKGHYEQLPPAVIVNLDETVWSNSPYQARIILQYGQHDMTHFMEWCNEAKCTAIPGAKEFLEHVKKQGVTIAYITPRPEITRDGTLRNLARLAYPYDAAHDLLLMDGDWPNHDKRESIGAKHRILVIVSDSLGDFMHDTAQETAVRREMAAQYADNWGLKWFLIPNPMYGHWEYSFQHYDYGLDRATRIQNKLRALDPEVDNQSASDKRP
jgi:acid phosphatase